MTRQFSGVLWCFWSEADLAKRTFTQRRELTVLAVSDRQTSGLVYGKRILPVRTNRFSRITPGLAELLDLFMRLAFIITLRLS